MDDDKNIIFTNSNVPPQIPTLLYVPDICRIAKRSGLNDGKDFILTNSNAPPKIPTFSYVPDICRIAKQSGLDDDKDFIFTDSNVPLQKSNTQNCKNDVHFQYAVFAFIE